jgi:hypothetical protein
LIVAYATVTHQSLRNPSTPARAKLPVALPLRDESPMAINTPEDYWNEMKAERETSFERHASDGPILRKLRWLFGSDVFHRWVESSTRHTLLDKGILHANTGPDSAKDEFNKAVEHYWILWTIGLLAIYILALLACHVGASPRLWTIIRFPAGMALFPLAFLALFRISEILAVSFRLHLLLPYKTRSPAHAMVLTFLAYVHTLIGFAVVYLAESYWLTDPFRSKPGLWANPVDSLYFSAVTITTVGYGDLSPEVWLGKLLAILEIFVGLILVVVTFQKVLAGSDFSHKGESSGGQSPVSEDPTTPTVS